MSISRDEAREVAISAILIAVALRIGSGVVRLIDEATGDFTTRTLASQFFAPIGSAIGIMTMGAVLLVVLSPSGSVTRGVQLAVRRTAGLVTVLGMLASVQSLDLGSNRFLDSLWFTMFNGLTVVALAGGGWWIMRNFDDAR